MTHHFGVPFVRGVPYIVDWSPSCQGRCFVKLRLSGIFISISWHRAGIFPVTPKKVLFNRLSTDQLQMLARLSACVAAFRTLNPN